MKIKKDLIYFVSFIENFWAFCRVLKQNTKEECLGPCKTKKTPFGVPMADGSAEALDTAHRAALGIGPANLHTSSQRAGGKGKFDHCYFCKYLWFFHYPNSLFLFFSQSLQMQSKNIYSLRGSMGSSLVQKKNGTTGRSEELLWVQQSHLS